MRHGFQGFRHIFFYKYKLALGKLGWTDGRPCSVRSFVFSLPWTWNCGHERQTLPTEKSLFYFIKWQNKTNLRIIPHNNGRGGQLSMWEITLGPGVLLARTGRQGLKWTLCLKKNPRYPVRRHCSIYELELELEPKCTYSYFRAPRRGDIPKQWEHHWVRVQRDDSSYIELL